MNLYPLGEQRDLETEFDKVDYNGWDGAFSGLLKKYFKENRRYNGLYMKVNEDNTELYYFTLSPERPTVDVSVLVALGYNEEKLLIGMESPLYVCKDVFTIEEDGKVKKTSHEEEIIRGKVTRFLIKYYLDPYFFKPQRNTYKVPDVKKF
jgi:hypothetical protein